MPHLNQLVAEFADEPIVFISITDEPPERISKFIARRKMDSWVCLDTDRSSFDDYGVTSLPRAFLIDPKGQLVLETRPAEITAQDLHARLAPPEAEAPPAPAASPPSGNTLPRLGGYVPGIDPFCMPWVTDGQMEIGFFYQSVVRPSLLTIGGHGLRTGQNGAVGATLIAKTIPEAFMFAHNLPSLERIQNDSGLGKKKLYDFVYSRPEGDWLETGREGLARITREAFNLETEFFKQDRDVLLVTASPEKWMAHDSVDWKGDPTAKSFRSLAVLLSQLESISGQVCLPTNPPTSPLYLDLYGIQWWTFSPTELRAFLEDHGASFSPARRKVTTLVIRPKG